MREEGVGREAWGWVSKEREKGEGTGREHERVQSVGKEMVIPQRERLVQGQSE